MKAIILAAGFASRLHPITLNKAKALIDINGKPVIEYIIDKIKEVEEISEIFVLSNKKFYNDFLDWKKRYNRGDITLLNNGANSPQESPGAMKDLTFAIKNAKIKEDFFLIAGDNIFSLSLKRVYDFYKKSDSTTFVFYDVRDKNKAKNRLLVTLKDGSVDKVKFNPKNPESTYAATSIYFFKKEVIPLLEEFSLIYKNEHPPEFFMEWFKKRILIKGYVTDEEIIDIGSLEMLNLARQVFFPIAKA